MEKATQPIGIGVVGLNFGLGRCAAIKEIDSARLVAVASRSEATARPAGEQLGVDWYTDYQMMLRRDDIDLIAIYTPSSLHQPIALDAAQAGKHILTTKPLETTLERIDTLITACQARGVKLATEYMSRYTPDYYRGYRAIADGIIGKPVLGEFSYKCYRPQSYYQGTRGTWAVDGGGAIMMQAIHVVDMLCWYMGPIATVTARWGTYTHQLEAEDTALALITFTSGAMATLVGTTTFHNSRPPGQYGGGTIMRVEVGGERGSLIISDGTLAMWKAEGADTAPAMMPPARNVFEDVSRWLRDDSYQSPTLVTGAEARRSVELVQAVYQSARTGQTVTLAG